VTDVGVDFFVSYTSADRPWAEWIAWELEAAGHRVIVQAWDMQPGQNFVVQVHHAARAARRTVAILSPAFLASPYCVAEWAAAFARDPTGQARTLVPVRVRDCDVDGLLGQIVYEDLVGLSEAASRAALLRAVSDSRPKPADLPGFPGALSRPAAGGERVRRPAQEGAAIFNVPVSARTFSGRARELKRLEVALRGGGRVAVVAVNGIGGVGKTQLAARYARTHRSDYDVVWWVRAEQPQTLRADLAALALKLSLPEAAGSDEQATIDALRAWFERSARWLVIFDNAPNPDAVAGELVDADSGHVLITSRAFADWGRVAAKSLRLDVWAPAEARAFLRARTGERDRAVLDAVADALGHLPLALEQAAAYTSTLGITLTGYNERLRDGAPALFKAGRPAQYAQTVATVWQLAVDEIKSSPAAYELLGVCAQLAPEQIPRDLLAAAGAHTRPAIGDAEQFDTAIALLLAYALLTPAAEDALGVHRLTGRQTRENATPGLQARWATAAVRGILELWPKRPEEHETWPTCQRLLAHALTAAQCSEDAGVAAEHTAWLLGRIGVYQRIRAELAAARTLTERAIAIQETVYGPTHHEVASTLTNLGIVQQQLGELPAAEATLQRALRINEAVLGAEHLQVALTLVNLGVVQEHLGSLEVARATQLRALAIFERVCGPEHPNLASVLGNLGRVHESLGELRAAQAAQQRALSIEETAYGPKHPEVARTLSNLGTVQMRLGNLELARTTQHRALAINEAVFGPQHPRVAMTLINLGLVQEQLGDLDAALTSQLRASEICQVAWGPEHPEVAIALTNLGNVQQQLGELEAARATQRRALAINEAVYGPEHPQVAITLTNLAMGQQRLGELEAARACIGRAAGVFERSLGPDHPHTRQAREILESLAD